MGFDADLCLVNQFGDTSTSGVGSTHFNNGDVQYRDLFNPASGVTPTLGLQLNTKLDLGEPS